VSASLFSPQARDGGRSVIEDAIVLRTGGIVIQDDIIGRAEIVIKDQLIARAGIVLEDVVTFQRQR